MQFFVEKYFPQTFEEFIGNSEAVENVKNWSKSWNSGKKEKPLLFFGKTGTGKTALALLSAKENSWNLFELNSSDFRTKDIIERLAGGAAFNASFSGKKRLVLLDEIDGLQGTSDKGGAAATLQVLKNAENPVILTANNIYEDKKLSSIRSYCTLIEFKKPNYLSIAKFLRSICEKESIDFDDVALKELAKYCEGDIRSALLDLQFLSIDSKKITLEDVQKLSFRERGERIFEVLRKIFYSNSFEEIRKARFNADIDSQMLFAWIDENIPKAFLDPIDQANAFSMLSRADIFNGRIYRRQHYGFLRYSSELSTSGVSLSKSQNYKHFALFSFPSILSKLSKSSSVRNRKKAIAEKMQKQVHGSKKRIASEDFPFLMELMKDKEKAASFSALYNFDSEDLSFLTGKKADSKHVEKILAEAEKLKAIHFKEKRHLPFVFKESEDSEDSEEVKQDFEQHNQTKLF